MKRGAVQTFFAISGEGDLIVIALQADFERAPDLRLIIDD